MLDKNISDITEKDVQELIDLKVVESKTIEYKRNLALSTDSEKKEFLADVTSFANASGGHIIIGVSSDNTTGEPDKLIGLAISNIDSEIQKIEQICAAGVRPKIGGFQVRSIKLANQSSVIIIRIPVSWNSPHMVVIHGTSKFFTRNSNGKHMMDVDELRTAFIQGDKQAERVTNFRFDRIGKILSNDTYLPLPLDAGKVVLHLIPYSAFSSNSTVAMDTQFLVRELKPMSSSGWNYQYNLDGFITFAPGASYVQLFRKGIIEAVDPILLEQHLQSTDDYIPSQLLERTILESFTSYFDVIQTLKIDLPVYISLSLVGIKKYRFATSGGYQSFVSGANYPVMGVGRKIANTQDVLNFTENLIQDFSVPSEKVFKPIFDSMWNAYGYERSENFDSNGNWKPK